MQPGEGNGETREEEPRSRELSILAAINKAYTACWPGPRTHARSLPPSPAVLSELLALLSLLPN